MQGMLSAWRGKINLLCPEIGVQESCKYGLSEDVDVVKQI